MWESYDQKVVNDMIGLSLTFRASLSHWSATAALIRPCASLSRLNQYPYSSLQYSNVPVATADGGAATWPRYLRANSSVFEFAVYYAIAVVNCVKCYDFSEWRNKSIVADVWLE